MMKKLIAPVLALSLAFAGGVKPAAAAEAEDIAKIIAGLAVVGIIAKAAQDNKDDRKAKASRSYTQYPSDRYDNRYGDRYDYRYGDRFDQGRGPRYGDGWRRMTLPGECVRTVDTRRGDQRVVGERCLERQGVRTARLPNRCEFDVRVGGRMRDAYSVGCLRNAGYRFDGDGRGDRRRYSERD